MQDGEELQNNHKPKEGVAPLEFPSSPFCNSGENMMGRLSGESVFRCLAVQTVLKSLDRRGFKTALHCSREWRTAFACKRLSLTESSAFPGKFLRTICTMHRHRGAARDLQHVAEKQGEFQATMKMVCFLWRFHLHGFCIFCSVRPSVSRQYLWFRNVGSKCFKKI